MGVLDSCVSAAVWEKMLGSQIYHFPISNIHSGIVRAPVLISYLS